MKSSSFKCNNAATTVIRVRMMFTSLFFTALIVNDGIHSAEISLQTDEIKPNEHSQQTTKAQKKCREYVKYACDHQSFLNKYSGCKMERILRGEDAPLGIIPHMAFIRCKRKKENGKITRSRCGGSLISENFVISAAHCAINIIKETIRIKLGSRSITLDDTGQWFHVDQYHVHPEYLSDRKPLHDILLLKLDRKARFSPYLRPICLNIKLGHNLRNLTTSGWGLDETETPTKHLKMVELHIDQGIESKCSDRLRERKMSNKTLICAADPAGKKSASQGDSGGPLQTPLNTGCPHTYELIGILSGGYDFLDITLSKAITLNIFAKIEYYVPWIENIVWPDSSSNNDTRTSNK